MDIYNEEFLKFWSGLNNNNVEYIMVGGVATSLNGYQRTTDDIDVWVKDSLENRKRLRKAFYDYWGIDFFMIETMQIIPGWTDFNLNNGIQLDIMLDMKGLEQYSFDECFQVASKADIDGVIVPFLHINHLIQNKKAVNRPKDQIDVIYLEKIKQIQEEQSQKK
jgi:hypothetical protein